MEDNSNINNGLITKIWGPGLWSGLHSITFGYPIHPTEEQKRNYRIFFTTLGDVLPCRYCRDSYKEFISSGTSMLTDAALENRQSLTKWLYLVHEAVNKKLGVNYGVSYNNVIKKYETYRAKCSKTKVEKGCIMPLYTKAESYKSAYLKESPIIPLTLAEEFVGYAKERGLEDEEFEFFNFYKKNCHVMKNHDIRCEVWNKRNKKCEHIRNQMRIDGTESVEMCGSPYEGLPTIPELRLILRLSSNLENKELEEMLNKLPKSNTQFKGKKRYRLVKSNV